MANAIVYIAIEDDTAIVQEQSAGTERSHRGHVVAHEQYRPSLPFRNLVHFSKALFLKFNIPYCQNFIDNQNLRLEICSHCEGETHIHSRRIMFHGCVHELFHLCKSYNVIKFGPNFSLRHAEDRAIKEDIFSPGELGMETSSDLKKARYAPPQEDAP